MAIKETSSRACEGNRAKRHASLRNLEQHETLMNIEHIHILSWFTRADKNEILERISSIRETNF